ncbi:ABC transporter permease [Prevotella sp. kh1p2]|uniref:ABC transporter permease n=1 Tax=Prevotella sp. kh1p2 TaxID=1761883 RepID=UPI0008AB870E|nr:ABC transporter permease [Prevotella sp. kh1p2]SET21897.1 putative ABC transport system permease protein [Prevotella sp. kh1p2]SNU12317.1 putative ABC transport system permease protein [Prevotellaceae bacterium KH2P17]
MEISIVGIVLGLLLLVVPVYLVYKFRLGLLDQTLVAVVKQIAFLSVLGVCLYYVYKFDSVLLNIAFVILMAVGSGVLTARRGRIRQARFVVPVVVGVLLSALVVGLYFLFFVMGAKNPFSARFLIPVLGLLMGCMIEVNAKALSTYYMGLAYHHQLYDYLTGNGASHEEAVRYFVRKALGRSFTPSLSRMAYVLVGTTPVMLWALLLAGVGVVTAVELQIMVTIACFSASVLSLAVTLLVARRYSFDEYSRLTSPKPIG